MLITEGLSGGGRHAGMEDVDEGHVEMGTAGSAHVANPRKDEFAGPKLSKQKSRAAMWYYTRIHNYRISSSRVSVGY